MVVAQLQWIRRAAVHCTAESICPGSQPSLFRIYLEKELWSYLRLAIRVPRDAQSVNDAIALTPSWPPSTVLISAGTYNEAIVVNKSLTLMADGQAVFLKARSRQAAITFSLGTDPQLPAKLHGFTVQGQDATCICVREGHAVIEGCHISSEREHGIVVLNNSCITLKRSKLTGNGKAAVLVRDQASGQIQENELIDNSGHAILISGSASPLVSNNRIWNNKKPAIVIRGEATARIQENTIQRNGDYGIVLCGSAQALVQGNQLALHELPAIAVREKAKGIVKDNVLSCNKGYGILVCGEAQPIVEGNTVNGQKQPAIVVQDTASPSVKSNHLESNEGVAMVIKHKAAPIVERNTLRSNKRKASMSCDDLKHEASSDLENESEAGSNSTASFKVTRAAITVRNTASGVFRTNTFHANGGYGILVSDEGSPLIEDNVFEMQRHPGIVVQDQATAIVRRNWFDNTGQCHILVQSPKSSTVEGNRLNTRAEPACVVWRTVPT